MRKTQSDNYNQLFSENNAAKGIKFGGPNNKRYEPSDLQALQYMSSTTPHGRILQFADQIIKFPKKERFNQDLDQSVKEINQQLVNKA